MTWWILILAGLLEVAWAVGLELTDGFRKPLASVLTVAALAASVGLLAWVVRELPLGTAYAVWVGIGAVGTAIAGVVLFGEPVTWPRVLFLVLIVVAIVGLKLTHPAS